MPTIEELAIGLRVPKNLVGLSSQGPLYEVRITWDAFERVRELARANETPLWSAGALGTTYATLVTAQPEWFMKLDSDMLLARRSP